MKKFFITILALFFTSYLTFAQWNDSGTTMSTNDHVNVGGNGNTRLKVRHLDGKSHNSSAYANLHINWNTGKHLYVGGNNQNSNLYNYGEMISLKPNSFRIIHNNVGVFNRNDGANYYTLLTNSGTPYGSWNTKRPFRINIASGNVFLGNSKVQIFHGGGMKILDKPNGNALEVCGTGKFKQVIVDNGWCDFVFNEDYDLMSIEGKLSYIEEHGHLPNFLSEEAMGGNINIGDVTKRQQQTIEEQMLYIGQLNEDNKTLKVQNEEINKKYDDLLELVLELKAEIQK